MANLAEGHLKIVWKKFLGGDKEAFAEIYNAYVDDLFRYGTKISADVELVKDAIQEIFLDLFLSRENHREQPASLQFYLILALKRNLIRKLKKNRKNEHRNILESDFFEAQYSFEEELIREESDHEVQKKVSEAIGQLPPKQKEAIYLRYNQELEYDQIATLLDISIESVRKQVYRAIKSIRDCLEQQNLILLSFFKLKQVEI